MVQNKVCTYCKLTLPLTSYQPYTRRAKPGKVITKSICKSCDNAARRARHCKRRGIPITLSLESCFKEIIRAAARRRPCTLTVEELVALYHAQEGRCALTGWPMTLTRRAGRVPTNLSLDRIDSTKDYTLSNVQLVCQIANQSKSDNDTASFLTLCLAIAVHQGLIK